MNTVVWRCMKCHEQSEFCHCKMRNNRIIEWTFKCKWSTHGDGRKVHLAINDSTQSLCAIEKRTDFLWEENESKGFHHAAAYLAGDPNRETVCAMCADALGRLL